MRRRRGSGLAAAILMAAALVQGVGTGTAAAQVGGFRAPTSALAHTDPSLLRARPPRPVSVFVKLDVDPVALYRGGTPGLPATSPSVTGRRIGPGPGRTSSSREAVASYLRYLGGVESSAARRIRDAIPRARVVSRYSYAYGGLAVRLPADRVARLARVSGVVAVQRSRLEHPLTDVTPGFLHASDLWPSLGGAAHAAEGVLVGVIDTGIWPEHPSF